MRARLNKEKQSRDADTHTKEETTKTNKLSCGSIHSVHESLDVLVSFHMLQVIQHVVGLVVLCDEFTCQCTKLIHFLTCTGIPCRDSHCENGLVRCCLCTTMVHWCIGNNLKALTRCKVEKAQPNATKRMPQEILTSKLPNAWHRARCASLQRGNDAWRQQQGAGAWTTQCQGQRDGNDTVTQNGMLQPRAYPYAALLNQGKAMVPTTKGQRLQSFTWQDDVNAAAVISWQIPPFCNCQAAGPSCLMGPKDSRTCSSAKQCGKHQLVDEECTFYFEGHVELWVYHQ